MNRASVERRSEVGEWGGCVPPMVVGKGFLLCWQIFSVMRGTASDGKESGAFGQMESFAWPRLSGGDRDVVQGTHSARCTRGCLRRLQP